MRPDAIPPEGVVGWLSFLFLLLGLFLIFWPLPPRRRRR